MKFNIEALITLVELEEVTVRSYSDFWSISGKPGVHLLLKREPGLIFSRYTLSPIGMDEYSVSQRDLKRLREAIEHQQTKALHDKAQAISDHVSDLAQAALKRRLEAIEKERGR